MGTTIKFCAQPVEDTGDGVGDLPKSARMVFEIYNYTVGEGTAVGSATITGLPAHQ